MTGTGTHILIAAVLALAAATVLARAAWLILRPARGRHEQREQQGDAEADTFIREPRALPAPGLDYISDRDVRLPWTPPAYALAAVDKTYPVVIEVGESPEPFDERAMWGEHWGQPGEPGERLVSDTDVRTVATPDTHTDTHIRIQPDDLCPCGDGPRHFPAGHDMVTSILGATPREPGWDVGALDTAGLDEIAGAFDTAQFEAVKTGA